MIQIDDKIVSLDLFSRKFVCNLQACLGCCCVYGDSGAPLEEKEHRTLKRIFGKIKPYISPKGIAAIELQGLAVTDSDGDLVTPLIDGNECAFTVFDQGVAFCGIEKAWLDGKIKFQKPISCHLYPIRISSYKNFEAVNFHSWEICAPACKHGEQLNVPLYVFLKVPLIRKYGKSWYEKLEEIAANLPDDLLFQGK
jgi:hypothetical protein